MPANHDYGPGEVIANKYVVEGTAGESPAARTFLANGPAGRIAIKVYRPAVSAALMAAPDFFLKAVVAVEIAHDNLAACLDVQEEMGQVFVARAFVEGETFEDWVRRNRGQAGHFSRGLEYLWQACQGLSALHERARHLNIHPGNLIVGPVGARLCDPDPRCLGNTEMTPEALPGRSEYRGYRAPEMAGRGAGFLSYPSSDLYSIAGLLFRLVKGGHPPSNPAEALAEARALDRDLAMFLGKALHPRPEERFQEAGAFADALWELQGCMQRLQESTVAPAAAPAWNAPAAAPDPFAAPGPAREPTLFGEAVRGKAPDEDSFFGSLSAAPVRPETSPPPRREPAPVGGDTLFGTPASPPPQPPARPSVPSYPQAASRGGLEALEQPGTLFGAGSVPPAPAPKRPSRSGPPPEPPKPAAVSLSALEKDPLESSHAESGSFTAYGFQGAGDNRTGIYNPDGQAAAARAKLRLLLGIAGALVITVALAALFIFLRGKAAEQSKPSEAAAVEAEDPVAPPPPEPAGRAEPPMAEAAPPAQAGQPYPEVASPEAPPDRRPVPAPTAAAAARPEGYSEPPMPVEPQRPGASPETRSPAASAATKGGAGREAELMSMIQGRAWPATAAERLKAADELNDFGKTAEANLLYGKALAVASITEKQKIAALGGMAATFQAMGMKDQAKDAVDRILDINPRNAFALKMKAKLQ